MSNKVHHKTWQMIKACETCRSNSAPDNIILHQLLGSYAPGDADSEAVLRRKRRRIETET